VIGGAPDHRDTALSIEEHGAGDFMTCVSSAQHGELRIDL
jgi:hypothetical protein